MAHYKLQCCNQNWYAQKCGMDVCGEIFEADLGAPYQIVEEISNTFAYDYDDVALYFLYASAEQQI
jgi:hypothetical protein